MRQRETENCLNNIVIQRYIDGEIAKPEMELYNEHLKGCERCQQRVEDRKFAINHVLDNLAFLENFDSLSPESRTSRRPFINYLKFAASLFIVIGLLSWLVISLNPYKIYVKDTCKWIEVEDPSFHPDFVSPNRLYNMKAIIIVETDSLGNHKTVYFEKKCYN